MTHVLYYAVDRDREGLPWRVKVLVKRIRSVVTVSKGSASGWKSFERGAAGRVAAQIAEVAVHHPLDRLLRVVKIRLVTVSVLNLVQVIIN